MFAYKKYLSWGYKENHYDVFLAKISFAFNFSSEQKKEEFHVCFYVNVHSSKMHLNEQDLFLVKVLRWKKKLIETIKGFKMFPRSAIPY